MTPCQIPWRHVMQPQGTQGFQLLIHLQQYPGKIWQCESTKSRDARTVAQKHFPLISVWKRLQADVEAWVSGSVIITHRNHCYTVIRQCQATQGHEPLPSPQIKQSGSMPWIASREDLIHFGSTTFNCVRNEHIWPLQWWLRVTLNYDHWFVI